MKIYNQDKTQELNRSVLNYEKGHLVQDRLFIAHHDAIKFKSAEEIAQELIKHGEVCNLRYDGNWYRQVKVCENGGSEEEIIRQIEAKGEYDEYKDILVYVPYTEEEISNHRLTNLREQRSGLLMAFDKWEKAVLRGREVDDESVMQWYRKLLDLDESAFEDIPARVKYFFRCSI